MNEKTARQVVYTRSAGVCEVCGGRRAEEWHHRRNRSQRGPWTPSNGLHLCSGCHRAITVEVHRASDKGWTVRSWEDWTTKPVLTSYGWVLLDDDGGMTEVSHD